MSMQQTQDSMSQIYSCQKETIHRNEFFVQAAGGNFVQLTAVER